MLPAIDDLIRESVGGIFTPQNEAVVLGLKQGELSYFVSLEALDHRMDGPEAFRKKAPIYRMTRGLRNML